MAYVITIIKNKQKIDKSVDSHIDLNKQLEIYRRKNVIIDDIKAVR